MSLLALPSHLYKTVSPSVLQPILRSISRSIGLLCNCCFGQINRTKQWYNQNTATQAMSECLHICLFVNVYVPPSPTHWGLKTPILCFLQDLVPNRALTDPSETLPVPSAALPAPSEALPTPLDPSRVPLGPSYLSLSPSKLPLELFKLPLRPSQLFLKPCQLFLKPSLPTLHYCPTQSPPRLFWN